MHLALGTSASCVWQASLWFCEGKPPQRQKKHAVDTPDPWEDVPAHWGLCLEVGADTPPLCTSGGCPQALLPLEGTLPEPAQHSGLWRTQNSQEAVKSRPRGAPSCQ